MNTGRRYTKHVYQKTAVRQEPTQRQKLEPGQVTNRAGGFTYDVGLLPQLDRFLVLGAGGESGTYYASEKQMTIENARVVDRLIAGGAGVEVVNHVLAMRSRVPKLEPALFALALVMKSSDVRAKQSIVERLPEIAWTGTQFFQFVAMCDDLRGWGRSLRRAVQNWYLSRSPLGLAKNLTKYRNREGWRHRDVLLKGNVRPENAEQNLVFKYVVARDKGKDDEIKAMLDELFDSTGPAAAYLQDIETMWAFCAEGNWQRALDVVQAAKLPREVLPTELLTRKETWAALLPHMGGQALLRNLGNMGSLGILDGGTAEMAFVYEKLTNREWPVSESLHPVSVLNAWWTYRSGSGVKGHKTWSVTPEIVSALEACFYSSFGAVKPIDKSVVSALDVSGSMAWGSVCGMNVLRPFEASALMSMVRARAEKPENWYGMGFSTRFIDLGITKDMSFDQVLSRTRRSDFGGTNTSVAIEWAYRNNIHVDLFEIYTDNETWAGDVHTQRILDQYRERVNPEARLAVIAFTSTRNTIGKPGVGYTLDVVGFDTSAPDIISGFGRREF